MGVDVYSCAVKRKSNEQREERKEIGMWENSSGGGRVVSSFWLLLGSLSVLKSYLLSVCVVAVFPLCDLAFSFSFALRLCGSVSFYLLLSKPCLFGAGVLSLYLRSLSSFTLSALPQPRRPRRLP